MELEAIVVQVLAPVKGTSARGEWTKQEVILEQPGEFSKKLCVSFWGDKAMDAASLKPGEKIQVSVNLESREYNGRWYTEVRAWKMVRGGAASTGAFTGDFPPPASPFGEMAGMPVSGDSGTSAAEDFDDLPF